MNANIPESQKATEYLAAERTFLAWIRTSIALMSLGFVVAKFGLWLRDFAERLDPHVKVHSTGASLPIGVGMMAMGGALALLALWHYHAINLAIDRGHVRPNRGLVVLVAGLVAAAAALVICYLTFTAHRPEF